MILFVCASFDRWMWAWVWVCIRWRRRLLPLPLPSPIVRITARLLLLFSSLRIIIKVFFSSSAFFFFFFFFYLSPIRVWAFIQPFLVCWVRCCFSFKFHFDFVYGSKSAPAQQLYPCYWTLLKRRYVTKCLCCKCMCATVQRIEANLSSYECCVVFYTFSTSHKMCNVSNVNEYVCVSSSPCSVDNIFFFFVHLTSCVMIWVSLVCYALVQSCYFLLLNFAVLCLRTACVCVPRFISWSNRNDKIRETNE